MTSPNDTELWSALSRQLQTLARDGEGSTIALQAYVERHRRRLRWLRFLDIGVTIVAVCACVWFIAHDRSAFSVLFVVDTLAVLAIVWTFSIVTGRGLSRATAASTAEYLTLARRFAHRRLQTVHLALALLAAQILVVGLMFPAMESPLARSFPPLPVAGTIAWLVWTFVTRRRALRELATIDALDRESSRMK